MTRAQALIDKSKRLDRFFISLDGAAADQTPEKGEVSTEHLKVDGFSGSIQGCIEFAPSNKKVEYSQYNHLSDSGRNETITRWADAEDSGVLDGRYIATSQHKDFSEKNLRVTETVKENLENRSISYEREEKSWFDEVQQPMPEPNRIQKVAKGILTAARWAAALVLPGVAAASFGIPGAVGGVVAAALLPGSAGKHRRARESLAAMGGGIGAVSAAVGLAAAHFGPAAIAIGTAVPALAAVACLSLINRATRGG